MRGGERELERMEGKDVEREQERGRGIDGVHVCVHAGMRESRIHMTHTNTHSHTHREGEKLETKKGRECVRKSERESEFVRACERQNEWVRDGQTDSATATAKPKANKCVCAL